MPFIQHLAHDASDEDIHAAILSNKLSLDGSILVASAQDLLRGMLCKDPQHRITLQQVLHHPWVVLNVSNCGRKSSAADTLDHVVEKSPTPNAGRKIHTAGCPVSAQADVAVQSKASKKEPVIPGPLNHNIVEKSAMRNASGINMHTAGRTFKHRPASAEVAQPKVKKEPAVVSNTTNHSHTCAVRPAVGRPSSTMNACMPIGGLTPAVAATLAGRNMSCMPGNSNSVEKDEEVDDEFPSFTRVKRQRVEVPSAACHQQHWRVVEAHQKGSAGYIPTTRNCTYGAPPPCIC
ncbi:hypothetical protein GOP47_0016107 [Adiantum capillus-veneris]|uniref:Uncharacterized protein n=1 Tax=Adiantum capillus-veneris TaxID=13818 RepID=A0A9D4ZEL0_ADICA|nr:hypothetical protein GOP47_0016107 [Adiantum capillus-veneris]